MRKLLFFFLFSILLFSLVSAGQSCTEPGYAYCWENSNSWDSANANARIYWQFEDDNGFLNPNSRYAVGNLYRKSGYSSNSNQFGAVQGYGFYNENSWDNIWNKFNCGNLGCKINVQDFDFSVKQGKTKLAELGETFTDCMILTAVDWRTNSGDWVWTGTGYGWTGNGNCFNFKVVECKTNSDCSSGKTCQSNECKEPQQIETKITIYIYGYEDGKVVATDVDELKADKYFKIWGYLGDKNDLSIGKQNINIYINNEKVETLRTSNGWIYFPKEDKTAGEIFNIGNNKIKLEFLGSDNYEKSEITRTLKVTEEQVCTEGTKKCEGDNLLECKNNKWITTECEYGCREFTSCPGGADYCIQVINDAECKEKPDEPVEPTPSGFMNILLKIENWLKSLFDWLKFWN